MEKKIEIHAKFSMRFGQYRRGDPCIVTAIGLDETYAGGVWVKINEADTPVSILWIDFSQTTAVKK